MSELGDFQILLIDDLPSDAKLFEHALQQIETRAKLYWVSTAEEGLEYLKREGRFAGAGRVRLVVSDLSMPGIDGFELLAAGAEKSGAGGYSRGDHEQFAIAAGCAAVLPAGREFVHHQADVAGDVCGDDRDAGALLAGYSAAARPVSCWIDNQLV